MNEYIAAIDCARKADRYVVMVSRNVKTIVDGDPSVYQPDRLIANIDVVYLDQWFGDSYEEMVRRTCKILNHTTLFHNCDLLVDGTGVGDAVIEMMSTAGLSPLPIIVTAGKGVRVVYESMGTIIPPPGQRLTGFRPVKSINVPKAELVAAAQVALQQQRVGIAKNVKWKDELEKQLVHVSPKATVAGNTRYESDDTKVHDDIAFCLMLTAWWSLRRLKDDVLETRATAAATREWDPVEYM